MDNMIRILISLVLLLTVSACGGNESARAPEPTQTPEPTATPNVTIEVEVGRESAVREIRVEVISQNNCGGVW